MQLFLVSLALTYIIVLYFYTNPLKHTKKFMLIRFINWFPLGMTYAFLYMGRYNLNVAKGALGDLLTKEDFGFIGGVGFTVYATSLFLIGPVVDRIGGKKGMIIGALGSSAMNMVMGLVLYNFLRGNLQVNLVTAFATIYGLNMLFQSFGAVSTIKVKSYWFHVRERGTFGAIFGTLISLGVYFAFDWGEAIANALKLEQGPQVTVVREMLNYIFALDGRTIPALWLIFYIPAILMAFWAFIDLVVIKDTPDEAGFANFETHDASHDDHRAAHEVSYLELMKRIFSSKIIWTIGIIELTSGVLRNGILQWYKIYAKETGNGVEHIVHNWGFWGCVTGIAGGFLAGQISDKLFQSRRAPAVGILELSMLVAVVMMIVAVSSQPLIMGIAAVSIMMSVIGVHSIMSGTATADFGGRKAAATATGVADAFAYVGSAIQSFALGKITTNFGWNYWPMFLLPFTVIGFIFARRIWYMVPAATAKYLKEKENIDLDGLQQKRKPF